MAHTSGKRTSSSNHCGRTRPPERVVEEERTLETPDEVAGIKAVVDSTTGLLLKIKNMTDKEIGLRFRDLRVEEQVKRYCKSKLFHWLKFIICKVELGRLDHTHDVGNVVMKGLHITDDSIKPRWWLVYQDVVKRALDTQRSNCNMAVKSVMVGTYIKSNMDDGMVKELTYLFVVFIEEGAMRTGKMPALDEVLGGRKGAMAHNGPIETTPYYFFCNKIVECVAGKKEWKTQKAKVLISR